MYRYCRCTCHLYTRIVLAWSLLGALQPPTWHDCHYVFSRLKAQDQRHIMAFSCTLYVIDLSNTTVILRVFVYSVFTGANAYTWTAFFFPAWLDHLQISAKSFWVFSVEQRYEKQCDNVMQWRGAGERVSGWELPSCKSKVRLIRILRLRKTMESVSDLVDSEWLGKGRGLRIQEMTRLINSMYSPVWGGSIGSFVLCLDACQAEVHQHNCQHLQDACFAHDR